jgi:hypothetical protein
MSSLRDAAPVGENSPILPSAKFVNVPAANGRVPSNPANAFLRFGCGGSKPPWVTVPASSVNNLTALDAAINLPFSENNMFLQGGGYRYKKSKKRGGGSKKKKSRRKSKKVRKTKHHKKRKTKHHKKRKTKHHKKRKTKHHKKSKRHQKGGSLPQLGSAPIKGEQNIPTSKVLNNIPYSQGFTINQKDSTDFGVLANPIPHESYAKCPPKIKFN